MKITRRSVLRGAAATVAIPASAEAHSVRTAISGGSPAAPHVPGSPYITAVNTLGQIRTDGDVRLWGYSFTVGSQPLLVTDVGRYIATGDGATHTVAIYQQNMSTFVAVLQYGTQVTINTAGQTPGTFVYQPAVGNPVLEAHLPYMILSTEGPASGGDPWYDSGFLGPPTMNVTVTSDATLGNAVNLTPAGTWNNDAGPCYVPLNFKYNVGLPGGVAQVLGVSGFSQPGIDVQSFWAGSASGVQTGTVNINAIQVYSGMSSGNVIYEWVVWSGAGTIVARSGALATTFPPPGGHQFCEWTLNTTTLPDGTYVYYVRFLDNDGGQPLTSETLAVGTTLIIANGGMISTGPQYVPMAPASNHELPSPRPDFLHYGGTPFPTRATHPLPYTFIPGSTSAALRNAGAWNAQSAGPRFFEYTNMPQWATTPSNGGVFVDYVGALGGNSTPSSYDYIIARNTFSGTRWNSYFSPFTTFVEYPAGGGVWFGAELGGRIFKLNSNGDVQNIVGWERDKSVLTYPGNNLVVPEGNLTRTLIGTFPAGLDLGGANDLCFDPRDSSHNTVYVVSQIDHWIAKVIISTQTVTVYAGTPGTAGYTEGAAASALFNNPSSIIMSDGAGNGGPAGTMYVSDMINCAIRKITPGGIVSTLCGGSLGPGGVGGIPSNATVAATTTFNLASSGGMVWSGGSTGSGAIVMAVTTNIKLGYSIFLSGGVNQDGLSNPNGAYVVTAWTNSQHFVVVKAYHAPGSSSADPHNGTMTGTMTFTSQNADVYSDPGTVPLSGSWFPFAYTIRFTSTNNIVLAEIVPQTCRLLDLSANTAARIGCFDDWIEGDNPFQWVWLAVNRAGTCGPTDDIIYTKFQDGVRAAHNTWRFSIDARWIGRTGYSAEFTNDEGGVIMPSYGPLVQGIVGSFGHYGWGIAISETEGRMIGTGTAQPYAAEAWIPQSGEPTFTLNRTLFSAGQDVMFSGTAAAFPYETRPSFYSFWGPYGGGGWITTLTFEDFMFSPYNTDAALGAYIQGGMGGSVPRPELTGNDLRNWIYNIRRGTVQGSVGPTVIQPGPDDPDNAPPIITSATITRTTTTNIHAVWTTDKSTIGMVGAASAVQNALGSYPIFSDIEAGAGTSHTMNLLVPPTSMLSPLYVQITVKDNAGNASHTVPVVIT